MILVLVGCSNTEENEEVSEDNNQEEQGLFEGLSEEEKAKISVEDVVGDRVEKNEFTGDKNLEVSFEQDDLGDNDTSYFKVMEELKQIIQNVNESGLEYSSLRIDVLDKGETKLQSLYSVDGVKLVSEEDRDLSISASFWVDNLD